jgi:hypothetical protein
MEAVEVRDYPNCMAALLPDDRYKEISRLIDPDRIKINWAHIAIAQLMAKGFVDRVLTTNFDPLVVRACTMISEAPAVYDMAVTRENFRPERVREKAVFHLHGQRDGFLQLHGREELATLESIIGQVIRDSALGRTWIVIGYSGLNDPVFRQLMTLPDFGRGLFWVGYPGTEPQNHVKTLLEERQGAFWISGLDADNFLYRLADRCGCFPPGFFERPFSHLRAVFGSIAGFRLPFEAREIDWAVAARRRIEKAIDLFEGEPEREVVAAWSKLMAGDHQGVLALEPLIDEKKIDELREPVALAFTELGVATLQKAEAATGREADRLFQSSVESFQSALKLKPDLPTALSDKGDRTALHKALETAALSFLPDTGVSPATEKAGTGSLGETTRPKKGGFDTGGFGPGSFGPGSFGPSRR